MDVTSLRDEHLDAAHDLWARTDHLGAVPRAEVATLRAHDPDLVLAAVEGDRVLGVVLGSYDGRRGYINRLAVDADARRRGVGRALVKELEDRLVRRGATRVNLLVFGGNTSGRSFWEEAGYRGTEELVMYSRSLDPGAGAEDAGPGC